MNEPKPFQDKIVLLTGASRGIGRSAALTFAKAGAHVVALARTRGALEELDDEIRGLGAAATLVQLDLADGDKVDALGPSLFARFGRLDVLIANSGVISPLTPLSHVKTEDWIEVMTVNLTANWRLIRTLEPLLKRSEAGRAVLISSGAAQFCRAYWGPYSVSKAGLEALAKTWAAELESTPVKVSVVNPGPVRTAMRGKIFPGEDPAKLADPSDIAPLLLELAAPSLTQTGQRIDYPAWRAARPV